MYAMCELRLRASMGFPDPPTGLITTVNAVLGVCALFTRYCLLPRTCPVKRCAPGNTSNSYTDDTDDCVRRVARRCPMFHPYEKTYEHGYFIDELGPATLVGARQLSALCERTSHSIAKEDEE